MRPVKVEKIYAVGEGLVQTIDLDENAPHNFVCCHACDAEGAPDTVSQGTVVYEVLTVTNPHWVDIAANNDMAAPTDSSFQAPATKLRVTISNEDEAMTHFRVTAVQYHA